MKELTLKNGQEVLIAESALDPKGQLLLTVAGWLHGKSKGTRGVYRPIVESLFAEFKNKPLSEYTTGEIMYFLKYYSEKRELCPRTFNLARACLSSLFTYAVRTGKAQRNPVVPVKRLKVIEGGHVNTVSTDQVEWMLKHSTSLRDSLIVKMLYYLGLRVSELAQIKMEDFSVRNGTVVMKVVGKGSRLRFMPIDDVLYEMIEQHAKTEGVFSGYLFPKRRSRAKERSLFMTRQDLWYVVRAMAKRAKLNPLPHPHTFRHTSATLAIEGGAPIHLVQHRLGHANIQTTQIYLHPSKDESLSKYIKKLGD